MTNLDQLLTAASEFSFWQEWFVCSTSHAQSSGVPAMTSITRAFRRMFGSNDRLRSSHARVEAKHRGIFRQIREQEYAKQVELILLWDDSPLKEFALEMAKEKLVMELAIIKDHCFDDPFISDVRSHEHRAEFGHYMRECLYALGPLERPPRSVLHIVAVFNDAREQLEDDRRKLYQSAVFIRDETTEARHD